MYVDYEKVKSTRENAMSMYSQYVTENGIPDENNIFSLPVMVLVGYFIQVHSKDPEFAVRKYLREHSITYRKANEVKMLVHMLSKTTN